MTHIDARRLDRYRLGESSYVEGLRPDAALAMSATAVLDLLAERLGDALEEALVSAADPGPARAGAPFLREATDGGWLRRTNVVGINMRTVGGAWGVIPYALTLPAIHDAIHVLPFFEPGVVGSLYGPVSWEIDPTLFSPALAHVRPDLDTAEKQLRAVVNLLHAMGNLGTTFGLTGALKFISVVLFQLPFYFLEILVGILQGMVFAMLNAVFIKLSTTHEEGHDESHAH